MNAVTLKKVLDKHLKWRAGEDGGEHANLRGASLSYANLSYANLSYANLSYANLSGADLSYANLSGADLRGTDLRGADLIGADLSYANLRGADLGDADLIGADLRGANLRGADLRGADLRGADLGDADLSYANLIGAKNIICVNLHDPRGYRPVAVNDGGEWRIFSGCRSLTLPEALEHWGEGYDGDREIGDRYVAALKALPECPNADGETAREVA